MLKKILYMGMIISTIAIFIVQETVFARPYNPSKNNTFAKFMTRQDK
jgi:hypothetical protein